MNLELPHLLLFLIVALEPPLLLPPVPPPNIRGATYIHGLLRLKKVTDRQAESVNLVSGIVDLISHIVTSLLQLVHQARNLSRIFQWFDQLDFTASSASVKTSLFTTVEAAAKERREAKAARTRRRWESMIPLQIVTPTFLDVIAVSQCFQIFHPSKNAI